jgi:hypothetical protein
MGGRIARSSWVILSRFACETEETNPDLSSVLMSSRVEGCHVIVLHPLGSR